MEDVKATGRPQPEAIEFLLQDLVRQQEDLWDSKTSIETRASFMLGLVGVILTLFASVFVGFWASATQAGLAENDNVAWWLGLLLTFAVMIALLASTVLQILVLQPRGFGIGIDIIDGYEKASNPNIGLPGLKEGALRALIPALVLNETTYLSAVRIYKIGELIVVVALVLAVEFVTLAIITSLSIGPDVRTAGWVVLAFVVGLTVAIGSFRLVRIRKAHRTELELQKDRMRQYEEFRKRLVQAKSLKTRG